MLARQPVIFRFLDAAVALNRQIGELGFLQVGRERRLFGVHFNRLCVGDARQIPYC